MISPLGAIEEKVAGAASSLSDGSTQDSASATDGIDLEQLAEILVKKLREELILEKKRAGQG